MSMIDWYASARVSSAHGSGEFVVREPYQEESPRVMIVSDRRRSMGFYAPELPWLDKSAAAYAAADAIARSAAAARAELGHADTAAGRSRLLPPGAAASHYVLERVREGPYDGDASALARSLAELARRTAEVPVGTFVFVVSDFLSSVPNRVWARLRGGGLDVVAVIVQDPTWEQSFPPVAGVLVPIVSPDGETGVVRLSAAETARLGEQNRARLSSTVARFRRLGFDSVVLGSSAPASVDAAFGRWAARRLAARRKR